jgi:ubiquinone/menaquinone biosynthesis C-methylase UbiE
LTVEPVDWHHGLMAERWAEFNTEAREAPFFLQEIARYGQPVLDLACGTGRITDQPATADSVELVFAAIK